jgi:uncharacterized protein (DUF302 family)
MLGLDQTGRRVHRRARINSQTTEFKGVRVVVDTALPFSTVLSRFKALMGRASIPELIALNRETADETEFARQVNERFVGRSGFMLFAEIDHGGWISKFGINRQTVRLILGNPLIAITMIRHDITAGLFVPVEVLITEETENATRVVYVLPSSLIVIEDNPPLRAAAEALNAKLSVLIVSAVCP